MHKNVEICKRDKLHKNLQCSLTVDIFYTGTGSAGNTGT